MLGLDCIHDVPSNDYNDSKEQRQNDFHSASSLIQPCEYSQWENRSRSSVPARPCGPHASCDNDPNEKQADENGIAGLRKFGESGSRDGRTIRIEN